MDLGDELISSEDFDKEESTDSIEYLDLLKKYWVVALLSILGIAFVLVGLSHVLDKPSDFEIIETSDEEAYLIVEIAGEVNSPGVYEMDTDTRVVDVINKAGGLTQRADSNWLAKVLNKAAKVTDGQKIYIPSVDEALDNHSNIPSASGSNGDQTISSTLSGQSEEKVNINEASAEKLESLWGIGRITAQNIIEQRPYSSVDELLSRKILKANVYERNKDLLTVY